MNRERPITKWIVYGASAVDIGAITGVLKLTDMTCPHNLYHSLRQSDGLFQPYCLRSWRPVSEAIMPRLQLIANPR